MEWFQWYHWSTTSFQTILTEVQTLIESHIEEVLIGMDFKRLIWKTKILQPADADRSWIVPISFIFDLRGPDKDLNGSQCGSTNEVDTNDKPIQIKKWQICERLWRICLKQKMKARERLIPFKLILPCKQQKSNDEKLSSTGLTQT